MDGLAVLQQLRKIGNQTPVLMLTAKTEVSDKVLGLETGADDYLTKPFVFAELQARVDALVRRVNRNRGADIFYADLRIDPVNHRVWRDKTEIEFTAKEYRMLAYLARNAESMVTRQQLADNCWDEPFATYSNIIDVYINYLRKKVDGPFTSKLIHTVRGKGYTLSNKM